MKPFLAIAFVLAMPMLASCETTPGEAAAGLGCGMRESLCIEQCSEGNPYGNDMDSYNACRDSCTANTGNLCQ